MRHEGDILSAPVYLDLEEAQLAAWLEEAARALGADDPFVRAALGGRPAATVAREAMSATALAGDVAARKALIDGGPAAITASTDPLLVLARRVEPVIRELRLKTRVGPLEAIAALSALARESEGLGPLAAREALLRSVDPLLGPLAEAGDEVQLVAAASELESPGIPLPTRNLAAVTAARLRLGLPGIATSPLEASIAAARGRAREGLWAEAAETLRAPTTGDRTASPLIRAEAHLFFAESLWRQGDTRGALEEIGRALKLPLSPKDARAGRVLRGDILFASGRLEDACADYRGAIAVDSTPWVEQQVDRCDREEGSEG